MPKTDASIQTFPAKVCVSWATGHQKLAQSFARENMLPIINELPNWSGLRFHLDQQGWGLIETGQVEKDAFVLRFTTKAPAKGKDPLLKSMAKAKSVLDLTAGWGTDAHHIAQSGRSVIAVERNPVISCLLNQAHAELAPELATKLVFLYLNANAENFLDALDLDANVQDGFDLVYIDPMFPVKTNQQAKAKKPMRLIQQLADAPNAENENRLLERALQIAKQRVVVKRALNAPYLGNRKPQGSIKSKLLRFDLYRP